MENSKIEWCDHTFNPWIGCTKVSAGCKHCYAERLMDTRLGRVEWGPQGMRKRTSDSYWQQPHKWNQEAESEGRRYRVFCASLADVFEMRQDDHMDDLEAWRAKLWKLIEQTPHLDWLLLTKLPENILQLVPLKWFDKEFDPDAAWPANVWVGVSVENQEMADKRIPELLKVPAPVRFLSCEPLLGPIEKLYHYLASNSIYKAEFWNDGAFDLHERLDGSITATCKDGTVYEDGSDIHWVIVGGESGPGARPMHPDWARDIRYQCERMEIPFFFKQWGAWLPDGQFDSFRGKSTTSIRDWGGLSLEGEFRQHQHASPITRELDVFKLHKKITGRLFDGEEWNQFPREERVKV